MPVFMAALFFAGLWQVTYSTAGVALAVLVLIGTVVSLANPHPLADGSRIAQGVVFGGLANVVLLGVPFLIGRSLALLIW